MQDLKSYTTQAKMLVVILSAIVCIAYLLEVARTKNVMIMVPIALFVFACCFACYFFCSKQFKGVGATPSMFLNSCDGSFFKKGCKRCHSTFDLKNKDSIAREVTIQARQFSAITTEHAEHIRSSLASIQTRLYLAKWDVETLNIAVARTTDGGETRLLIESVNELQRVALEVDRNVSTILKEQGALNGLLLCTDHSARYKYYPAHTKAHAE